LRAERQQSLSLKLTRVGAAASRTC
jgi:hypothetical protein